MKFYNREKEMRFLRDFAQKPGKKMIVVYGRRRIGKTTLLKKTFEDARYFFVDSRNCKDLLRSFSHKISNAIYTDWESFLIDLLKSSKTVVFDEFQNFLRTCPYVLSIFQKVWDEYQGEAFLILCGSYSGMMKRIFTDGKSPLFGRTDALINLKPFGFTETLEMLRDFGYSFEEAITWYSIFGGVPKYLWLLKDRKSVEEKIFEVFFDEFSPLKEEGKNILVLEFGKEHPGYFSVLKAIGGFERELSEIVSQSGLERTTAMKYISELRDSYAIVKEVQNLLQKRKRGKRYKISDFFLRFWMRFVQGQIDVVEVNPEAALKHTMDNLSQHVGLIFEDIILETLKFFHSAGVIPEFDKAGKGWIKDKQSGQVEIDVVAEGKNHIILIECKWREKPFNRSDLEKFLRKIDKLPSSKEKIGVVISKGGFNTSAPKNITFLDLDVLEDILGSQNQNN